MIGPIHCPKNFGRLPVPLVIGLVSLACGLTAQHNAQAQVVVHLPQYSQFRVNSSFFVPDGGSVYQGGVGRMSMGSNSAGIPMLGNVPGLGRLGRNRGIGYSTSSTGVVTTAKIYNMREIGDGILNGTHDSYGNRIQAEPTYPFRNSDPVRTGSPSAYDERPRQFAQGRTSTAADREPGIQSMSPEQILRRAKFLKANLGRNR